MYFVESIAATITSPLPLANGKPFLLTSSIFMTQPYGEQWVTCRVPAGRARVVGLDQGHASVWEESRKDSRLFVSTMERLAVIFSSCLGAD